jgi:hypothetical protein
MGKRHLLKAVLIAHLLAASLWPPLGMLGAWWHEAHSEQTTGGSAVPRSNAADSHANRSSEHEIDDVLTMCTSDDVACKVLTSTAAAALIVFTVAAAYIMLFIMSLVLIVPSMPIFAFLAVLLDKTPIVRWSPAWAVVGMISAQPAIMWLRDYQPSTLVAYLLAAAVGMLAGRIYRFGGVKSDRGILPERRDRPAS